MDPVDEGLKPIGCGLMRNMADPFEHLSFDHGKRSRQLRGMNGSAHDRVAIAGQDRDRASYLGITRLLRAYLRLSSQKVSSIGGHRPGSGGPQDPGGFNVGIGRRERMKCPGHSGADR